MLKTYQKHTTETCQMHTKNMPKHIPKNIIKTYQKHDENISKTYQKICKHISKT